MCWLPRIKRIFWISNFHWLQRNRRAVFELEVRDFLKEEQYDNAEYFEISAKTGEGVEEIFRRGAELLLNQINTGVIDQDLFLVRTKYEYWIEESNNWQKGNAELFGKATLWEEKAWKELCLQLLKLMLFDPFR